MPALQPYEVTVRMMRVQFANIYRTILATSPDEAAEIAESDPEVTELVRDGWEYDGLTEVN